jgi:hypothetical protein
MNIGMDKKPDKSRQVWGLLQRKLLNREYVLLTFRFCFKQLTSFYLGVLRLEQVSLIGIEFDGQF